MDFHKLTDTQILDFRQNAQIRVKLSLNECIKSYMAAEDWNSLDTYFRTLIEPTGVLFKTLLQINTFDSIENIINIRDAKNDWEEDGIWHDDGSRLMAFSLGLNLMPATIIGGDLLFRKKSSTNCLTIKAIPYGEIIIFKTGVDGYEHKVTAVTKGTRIIIAGWCS
jgi:hypothetical protein